MFLYTGLFRGDGIRGRIRVRASGKLEALFFIFHYLREKYGITGGYIHICDPVFTYEVPPPRSKPKLIWEWIENERQPTPQP